MGDEGATTEPPAEPSEPPREAPPEGEAEAPPEGSSESPPEAPPDAPPEAPPDAPPEAPPEAPQEAPPEAPPVEPTKSPSVAVRTSASTRTSEVVPPAEKAPEPGKKASREVVSRQESVSSSKPHVHTSTDETHDGEVREKASSKMELSASKSKIASSASLRKSRSASVGSEKGKLNSRAKLVLGSVLSIKRLDSIDEKGEKGKVARYANSYKLESDNPFNPEKVEKILESVMVELLENMTYDHTHCPKQAKWAASAIRGKVKELGFDRYKLVCIVTIGEKNFQDVLVATRFLWDVDRDRFAKFTLENTHVFGIAQCFGLYYE